MSTMHIRLITFYVKVHLFYLLMFLVCTTPDINIDLFGSLTAVQF